MPDAIRGGKPAKQLQLADIIVLSFLFFADYIMSSIQFYFSNVVADTKTEMPAEMPVNFSIQDNYNIIIMELGSLVIIFVYLYLRRFDYSNLTISFDKKVILQALLLIGLAGITADIIIYVGYMLASPPMETVTAVANNINQLSVEQAEAKQLNHGSFQFTFSLLLVSLLNGFYEEVFFLGLLCTVSQKLLPASIIIGLIIRFLLHIYQGIFSALIILAMGIIFLVCRKYIKNLVPFFLAHAFFDFYGLILFWHLVYI
ncbi:MAG: hypothetical protein CSA44_01135 [Gammaproteobacteria bacterium]|nr:MAG: hypothetical protein CSA44_01135 [Gammaproteobacteria bacterium]